MPRDDILLIAVPAAIATAPVLERLTGLDEDGRITLHGTAVLRRADDGRVGVTEQTGDATAPEPARHGGLATVLAVVAEAVDALLMGNSGMVLAGAGRTTPTDVAIDDIAASLAPGATAFVAHVTESDPAAVDHAMTDLGVTVTRRPMAEFEAGPARGRPS